ncbi:MAG: cation transporter [Desulfomonile sp.]|nr:cation transporter [Desulfomonile sp.]
MTAMQVTTIKIEGMSCEHCVAAVTKALHEVEGVCNCRVDLSSGEATFDQEKPVDMSAVIEAVEKAGYQVG